MTMTCEHRFRSFQMSCSTGNVLLTFYSNKNQEGYILRRFKVQGWKHQIGDHRKAGEISAIALDAVYQ